MPNDTEVQQLIIYVGTQAKIDEARQAGTIGPDDFAVVTNAPEFALQSTVQAIQVLIPNQASAQNQLADKDFVNSSIATNTGNFIGTFNSVEERDAYTGDITNNDYCFVINGVVTDNGSDWSSFSGLNSYDKSLLTNYDYGWVINGSKFDLYRFDIVNQVWELRAENIEKDDVSLNTAYNRYKATVAEGSVSWEYEYTLNNSSFTAAQWLAINSGATQENIAQITTNKNAIGVLSNLTTADKSSLVSAVNELQSGKQTLITGGASTITTSNLTANRALISNAQGKVAVSSVTNTELGYLSGATSSIQTQLNGKASTSLDNLSANGQMVVDSQNGTISNCILEIPQDIKLELASDGTLTLKSGSIITFPDGTQYQLTTDRTNSGAILGGAGKALVCCSGSGQPRFRDLTNCVSGAGSTTSSGFAYDTTTNKIGFYNSTGVLQSDDNSMPICIVSTGSDGKITSIDKVFNGAGYIGHHAFVLPGVKALMPYGFNTDGSLKSNPVEITSLGIVELNASRNCLSIYSPTSFPLRNNLGECDSLNNAPTPSGIPILYVRDENSFYSASGDLWYSAISHYVVLVDYAYNGTSVTRFDVRQPVRLATTEMLSEYQTKANLVTSVSSLSTDTQYPTAKCLYDTKTAIESEITSGLDTKIDKGYAVNDFATNCITEIPQDIKLGLSNGTLTLKSGSVITAPDGTQRTTTQDQTTSINTDGQYILFVAANNGSFQLNPNHTLNKVGSGSSLPADGSTYEFFFNTSDQTIYRWRSSLTTWVAWAVALPIGIITASNGAISSIDQVFNGAGYIGHHAFVLPGVKMLIPDGFNVDGTLKSIERTNTTLRIIEINSYLYTIIYYDSGNFIGILRGYKEYQEISDIVTPETFTLYYISKENATYYYSSGNFVKINRVKIVDLSYNGTSVTRFDVRPVSGLSGGYINTALGYTPYNSSNPDGYITSSALTDYELKATIQTLSATDSITLSDNTIYNGGEQTALTIALPVTADVSFLCEIDFTSGATPATLSYPNSVKWTGDDVASNVFIPVARKRYTVIVAYDGVNYRATVKGV